MTKKMALSCFTSLPLARRTICFCMSDENIRAWWKGYAYHYAVEPDVTIVVVAAEFETDVAVAFKKDHLEDASA